jgi:HD-GYP domain-containing protein (c-di-GMP phosphodiesterase class II)
MKQRYPLHTFVRRILLRRLILVALAVSLLVGGWTWIHERNLAQERVVKVALDRLAIIRAEFFHLVSSGVSRDEAVPLAINSLGDMEFDLSGGAFAAAVFYDRNDDFHVFGDTTQAACQDALSLLGQDRSRQPELGQQFHSLVRVTGRRAVHIVVPIANREGQLVSWVRAVYLLSPSASAVLIREPLTSVGLVILIVLSISALFYPVVLRMSRRLAGFSADLLEANLEMMEALGCAIAKRDGDTDAHNYRVTIYSVRLAEKEGLSLQAIQGLIKGAFLHDIGKIGIRDDVLLKPGRLTEDEYEIMKTHVNHGLDIVGRARWLHDALAVVGSHHEKFGGDGYPDRIPGNMIPSAARIFAITDVFDALSSERPYKKPMPLAKVVEILEEGRDQHFDPALLDSFLEIAPDLHAELNHFGTNELRVEMHEINSRYFASSLETMLV